MRLFSWKKVKIFLNASQTLFHTRNELYREKVNIFNENSVILYRICRFCESQRKVLKNFVSIFRNNFKKRSDIRSENITKTYRNICAKLRLK